VNDGTGPDIAYTAVGTQLSANWTISVDAESGISKYWYAIGTSAGGADVVGWTDNGANTSVTRTGLSLADDIPYYVSVKAENGIGLQSSAKSSNGQTVDRVAPTARVIVDSGLPAKTGTLSVKLVVAESNGVAGIPQLAFTPPGGTPQSLALTHLTLFTWTGTGFIESYFSAGAAAFAFGAADLAGNTGSVITAGTAFDIDTSVSGVDGGSVANSDGTIVMVPAGTSGGDLRIVISTVPSSETDAADRLATDSHRVMSADLAREFTPDPGVNPAVTIRLYYPDADDDGKIDGDFVPESAVQLYTLEGGDWKPVAGAVRDPVENSLTAPVPHLSIYSIRYSMGLLGGSSALSSLKAYPNPCYLKLSRISFGGIPPEAAGVSIRIYDEAGNLVRTLSRGDGLTAMNVGVWDGMTGSGRKAASGLYLYVVKTASHGQGTGKFVVFW
jgi:hypothetical protein